MTIFDMNSLPKLRSHRTTLTQYNEISCVVPILSTPISICSDLMNREYVIINLRSLS